MKRILVIEADGSERELTSVPNLKEMQKIVGGLIEHVTVLDRRDDQGNFIYTSMYINEGGLLDGLPRNEKATAIYQRNIRAAYPDDPNPFKTAEEESKRQAEASGMTIIDARTEGYSDDPHIVGPVIFFEGWTREEAEEAYLEVRHKD